MRIPRWASVAAIAVAATALSAGAGFGVASASTRPAAKPIARTVSAGVSASPRTTKAAWQGDVAYTVPTGTTDLFYHYACPAKQIALSGSFHNASGSSGATLSGSFPRTDITPLYSQWGWVFLWPGGSPAGYSITFDVYCK
ncbi:MAG: hypothetical protein ABSH30_05900 [Acidimicrobiales bacterium]|jgi:hypothetical protein